MKKMVIVTGSKERDIPQFTDEEVIVGVDAGALFLAQNRIVMDYAIGDFDSITSSEKKEVQQFAQTVLTYPKEKDETDTLLALQLAKDLAMEEIVMYHSQYGRIDHMLANIKLLNIAAKHQIKLSLQGAKYYITLLDAGNYYYDIKKYSQKYWSFLALEQVKGLTLKGFKYEVNDVVLKIDDIYAVSNEAVGDKVNISFDQGKLLLINASD